MPSQKKWKMGQKMLRLRKKKRRRKLRTRRRRGRRARPSLTRPSPCVSMMSSRTPRSPRWRAARGRGAEQGRPPRTWTGGRWPRPLTGGRTQALTSTLSTIYQPLQRHRPGGEPSGPQSSGVPEAAAGDRPAQQQTADGKLMLHTEHALHVTICATNRAMSGHSTRPYGKGQTSRPGGKTERRV